jgi:cell division protein FtsN
MVKQKIAASLCCTLALIVGCSRQQSDWQKTREANTADAYQQFLKKYPSGEFTPQAQARIKELYEERDWQKARDADTPEAYQAFLKQYPEGKWTEEARIRVENFTLAQAPSGAPAAAAGTDSAAAAGTEPATAAGSRAPATGAAPPAASTGAAQSAPAAAAPSSAPQASKAAVKSDSGPYRVQLGAFKTGAHAAAAHWSRLQQEYPTLLAGLSSKVLPKKTADGNLYRLQAVGLTEKHARAVCSALKAKAEACIVVPPANG